MLTYFFLRVAVLGSVALRILQIFGLHEEVVFDSLQFQQSQPTSVMESHYKTRVPSNLLAIASYLLPYFPLCFSSLLLSSCSAGLSLTSGKFVGCFRSLARSLLLSTTPGQLSGRELFLWFWLLLP